jgi:hypothetical protein
MESEMKGRALSLGLDFGTNSARALLAEVESGQEVATAVHEYETGQAGIILDPADPNLARQDPRDYVRGTEEVVRKVLALEKIAKIALGTLLLGRPRVIFPRYLVEKHHQRKHGPGAYYGQKRGAKK